MKRKSLPAPTAGDGAITADPFAQLIKGIGPTIERRLVEAGIFTVTQLAAKSVAELTTVVADMPGMSAERIEKEDWLGQARQVVQAASPQPDEWPALTTNNRQHYASFTLQLLLNEDYSVRRTQIVNNKNKTDEQWEGWDEERLLKFITGQAGLRLSAVKANAPIEPGDQAVSLPKPPATPKGQVHLRQLEALLADTDSPRHLISHAQPFRLGLTLELVDIDAPDNSLLDYTASIYAKKLGIGTRDLVAEKRATVPLQRRLSIPIDGILMPPGTYRLQARVKLNLPHLGRGFETSLEGNILQVY
jgi:hypothetical protein